ncbi:MAG: hypothetical protein ACJ788_04175 [Ktedonobacteraceae bacterium]
MEKHAHSFDVCVICTLPEEARVFLEVVRPQCVSAIEERTSSRYHYSYRFATLKNNKDEPLNLHISWLPRYGPQEMTLHLSRVLEECQPRIAIMTGICAGDAQRVQLGDLVVAERTFTYDNGKFILNEHGRSVHERNILTYQLDTHILQFLGLFDEWEPLVERLKRPTPATENRLERRGVRCHIKAMASGSAVRADHPFEDVLAPVRGTVAIDMEGAAFGLVMSRHPLIPWLVVKGVCDYADSTKDDAYHDYAARASALYALSFIRAYVTNERLPQRVVPAVSDRGNIVHQYFGSLNKKATGATIKAAIIMGTITAAIVGALITGIFLYLGNQLPSPKPTSSATPAATATSIAPCAAAPTLTRPADGLTLNARTVILTWEAPQGCLPEGYTVRISANYDPEAKPWIVDTGWAPTDYIYTFSADGTYYWHIRACKPCTPFHPGHWAIRSFTIHT